MNRLHRLVGSALLVLVLSAPAWGDLGFELRLDGGYAENLLQDSSRLEDSYTNTTASVNFYPVPSTELKLTGGYAYYKKTIDLGNYSGSVSATFIPTHPQSKWSVSMSGSFLGRRYREFFNAYDYDEASLVVGAAYALGPRARIRSSASYRSTAYLGSDEGDKESFELAGGMNFTPFGSNSFDLEFGFSQANCNFLKKSINPLINPDTAVYSRFAEYASGNIQAFFISPRFSRPLCSKTGLNLTFVHRDFTNTAGRAVYGYSTGFLSPFASTWEGQAYSINLKTYRIPKLITTVGFGYWDKTFLDAVEDQDFDTPHATPRSDQARRLYVNVQLPVATHSGLYLEPSLRFEYTDNNSTNPLFVYSGVSVQFGTTVQF